MIIRQVRLETVCGPTSRLPEGTLPEIAFAGRSNVGKSTLINGLMNRKALARVSAQPGKTRTINFYRINDDCCFVDLPGYGYAKVPAAEQQAWKKMIERYLRRSAKLRTVVLLVDIRRDVSEGDLMMAEWIRAAGYPLTVVATKADKVRRSQKAGRLAAIRKGFSLTEGDRLFSYSGQTKEGRDEIMAWLDELVLR